MLELRRHKEDEIPQINLMLIEEKVTDLELNENIVVLVENNIVLGICKVDVENSNSVLHYLIIKENSRGENLGDGLLRTVLNRLHLQNIKKIYYNNLDLYLIKKGFTNKDESILELNISEFFLCRCKCSGELDEI